MAVVPPTLTGGTTAPGHPPGVPLFATRLLEARMTVISFRPRPVPLTVPSVPTPPEDHTIWCGTFRSPRGKQGVAHGQLRLQRLVIEQRGAVVTGIFTAELREPDGTLIGVDSQRVAAPADMVRVEQDLRPVVRSLRIELLGIPVTVNPFSIDPVLAFPHGMGRPERRTRRSRAPRALASADDQ